MCRGEEREGMMSPPPQSKSWLRAWNSYRKINHIQQHFLFGQVALGEDGGEVSVLRCICVHANQICKKAEQELWPTTDEHQNFLETGREIKRDCTETVNRGSLARPSAELLLKLGRLPEIFLTHHPLSAISCCSRRPRRSAFSPCNSFSCCCEPTLPRVPNCLGL